MPVLLPQGQATSAAVYRSTAAGNALLVLAHGAGAGQTHPFIVATASGLARRGIDVVTFDFPYKHAGRGAPDRAPVLEACFESVAEWALQQRRVRGGRLFIGGKSMGGRIATHLAAGAFAGRHAPGTASPLRGIIALGYPLHPPGKPAQLRTAHLPNVAVPALIVQGSRDAFGTPDELAPHIAAMRTVTLHVVNGGDHSFGVRGTKPAQVLDSILDAVAAWIADL